jgi:predicted nuclease of restriction endonuclease-like (RecB) superfamily
MTTKQLESRRDGATELESLKEYRALLSELKAKVKSSQLKAAVAVNKELIRLYWEIGTSVLKIKRDEKWGSKVIEKLAQDLRSAFPNMKGFSLTNIKYMVQFAKEYPGDSIGQQAVGQIPWGHNVLLLQKLNDTESRFWYASKTIENGWSRNVLLHHIDSGTYERSGKALTNFAATLPEPQSDLALQTLKDPYNFDFLTLRDQHDERELEEALIDHIQKFLLELGEGFAFMGRQVHLEVGDQDFFVDLLFYHTKLRCYVVVELKAGAFKPEYAGKLNFYLTAVDEMMKHEHDNPTIGLLLCKTKNKVVAEYSTRRIDSPVALAEYGARALESLPENLKGSLPSIDELELELEGK